LSSYVVVDASIAVKWVVPENDAEIAEKLYVDSRASDTTVLVPPHLQIEVTNALRKKVWRNELTTQGATAALHEFLRREFDSAAPPGLYERALELANRYDRRGVYDSHYVALAVIVGCDLWTADNGLVNVMARDMPFIKALKSYE
jgi:predicted nucleic acid-binding protein